MMANHTLHPDGDCAAAGALERWAAKKSLEMHTRRLVMPFLFSIFTSSS